MRTIIAMLVAVQDANQNRMSGDRVVLPEAKFREGDPGSASPACPEERARRM